MIAEILFWLCVLALFHSYVLYPLILSACASNKMLNSNIYTREESLPHAAIFIPVHNEEKVIGAKLQSIIDNDYPQDKLRVYIGSDGSTDGTAEIVRQFQQRHSNIFLTEFEERNGKPQVLNKLVQIAKGSAEPVVYIFTDANVLFEKSVIYKLLRHFRNNEVGLVGADIRNSDEQRDGISLQEKRYIRRENTIKHNEGLCWGSMMGAFGGCFAMRAKVFTPIPANYIVDDFYLTMQVLKKEYKAISDLEAVCYEDVSSRIHEEFRRKARISAGNFQNLGRFYGLLWPPYTGLAFSFFSHKVLRWLGPFFIMLAFVLSIYLSIGNLLYKILFLIQSILLLTPLFDYLVKKTGAESVILRFISYFYYMNLALLAGFIKYAKGIKTNVWQPTERN